MRSWSSLHAGVLLTGALVLVSPTASAEAPKGTTDAAAAEALFYEARGLMRDGKYSLACPKLEESFRIDHGMGTQFNLADCNEKLGKLATAWTGFTDVAAAARTQNQPAREKVARDRARSLEPRLSKLMLDTAATEPPPADLEVKLDGVVIASAFAAPTPIDPGPHQLTATAKGKQPWETSVTGTEGRTTRMMIPVLLPLVAEAAPAVPPPAPIVVHTAPSPAPALRIDPPPPAPFPEPIVEHSTAQRTLGLVLGVVGLGGLGVATGFALDSLSKRDAARNHCEGDLCDPRGLELRDKAMVSGNIATIAGIAGGAVLVGGAILVLTAPKSPPRREERTIGSLRAAPYVASNGGGFSFQGVFQ